MTDFRIHTKVKRSNTYRNYNELIRSPLQNAKQDFNLHWNVGKSEPELENVQDTDLQFGYGAYASIEAELIYEFNSLRDVKFEAKLYLDSYVGAKFVIPDEFTYTFLPKKFKEISLAIPNLGFSRKFLKKYDLKIGVFFNLEAQIESLVLEVPIGFQYYKGYRFIGNKNILITPSKTLDSPWKYNFMECGEDNSGKLKALEQTINSATLTANIPIHIFLSFNFEFGNIKTSLYAGLNFPFQIIVGFDTKKCSFPFITLKFVFPIQMTLALNELKFLGCDIWKKHDTLFSISKTFTIGPKCIAPNLAQLYYKPVPQNTVEKEEPEIPINPVHENLPSNENNPEVPVLEEKVNGNHQVGSLYFEGAETCGIWRLIVPSKFKNSYALISTKNFILSIDGATILNEFNNLIKITGTVLDIFMTRIEGIEEYNVDVYLCNLCVGNMDPAVYLTEMNVKQGLNNIVVVPAVNGHSHCLDLCKECKWNQESIFLDENSCIFFFDAPSDEKTYIFGCLILLPPEQPSLDYDFGHLSDIVVPEGEDPFVPYSIYCDNTKRLLMEYTLNGENVQKINDQPKDNIFEFDIPVQSEKKFIVTFTPICDDESGIMCQLQLDTPQSDGYYILKYPNRDGISITGSGFLVEAIHVKANEPIYYYKYDKESVSIIKKYSDSALKITPKIEDVAASSSLLENMKRICLYNDEDNFIIPFSRKSSQDDMDEFYKSLGINIEDDEDYQKVNSDENGCLTFPAEMLTRSEISLSDLPENAADIKFERPNNNNNNNDNGKKKGLSPGAIAGIVIGVIAVVAIIVVVVVLLVRKKASVAALSDSNDEATPKD